MSAGKLPRSISLVQGKLAQFFKKEAHNNSEKDSFGKEKEVKEKEKEKPELKEENESKCDNAERKTGRKRQLEYKNRETDEELKLDTEGDEGNNTETDEEVESPKSESTRPPLKKARTTFPTLPPSPTPKHNPYESKVIKKTTLPSGVALEVRKGDLTEEVVDAIVNAANNYLAHGGGVAGAIMRKGGSSIQKESDRWTAENGNVPTGSVAYTKAGSLPCKFVLHAVGPVWNDRKKSICDKQLFNSVFNSLKLADKLKLQSISIPAISSGIFGFPKPRCAMLLFQAVLEFDQQNPHSSLKEIRFTNFDQPTVSVFEEEFERLFEAASNDVLNEEQEEENKLTENEVKIRESKGEGEHESEIVTGGDE